MSVSTQLRLPGISLGIGELLLLCWVAISLGGDRAWMSRRTANLALMIMCGGILLGAGYLSTYPNSAVRPSPIHDSMAYLFCALLAANYITLREKTGPDIFIQLGSAFMVTAVASVTLGWVLRDQTGLDALYNETRWRHLSSNPNQFALMVLPLPFLALYFLRGRFCTAGLFLVVFTTVLALFLGWASQSDALAAAWVIGGVFVVIGSVSTLRRQRVLDSWRAARLTRETCRIASMAFILALMVCGSIWQFRQTAAEISGTLHHPISDLAKARSKNGADSVLASNQVGTRYTLWYNAVVALERSPIFGLGPGAHSGFSGPFGGEEAHNTLLDWGSQAGILGLLLLLACSGWIFFTVVRSRHVSLGGMLIALGVFSMFHFTMRQPIFWLVPLLALDFAGSSQRRRSAAVGEADT